MSQQFVFQHVNVIINLPENLLGQNYPITIIYVLL